MADKSNIEWTDATWQPITGCSIVSPGCAKCYAMKLAGGRLRNHPSRKGLTKIVNGNVVWTGEVRFNEKWLTQPLGWREPKIVFVCAHGDLFHEDVPDEWIDKVFAVMALCPQHTFQVLTKRAERMRAYVSQFERRGRYVHSRTRDQVGNDPRDGSKFLLLEENQNWPLPNVWLGVSAERQQEADERIPHLLQTRAAIRFVSAEPLLGPVDLMMLKSGDQVYDALQGCIGTSIGDGEYDGAQPCAKLDWIIVGGESGPGAHPMHPDWARSLRDQCNAAGVAFFFKQWGAWAISPGPGVMPDTGERETWVGKNGKTYNPSAPEGQDCWAMARVGKKAAGRMLDNREHNDMPLHVPQHH